MPIHESDIATQKWMRIAFINLLVVALLGVLMRYKIAYYFPLIEQKNFLHAHSHFAFTGWITQALITLMIACLAKQSEQNVFKRYHPVLLGNLIVSYIMLLSFSWQGYGIFSIIASSFSIAISYIFTVFFWRDLNKAKKKSVSSYWFKAALVFNLMSSLGVFSLSFMMANKISHPNWFLASTYFFLHFQYNGWFFFACMGLLSERLTAIGFRRSFQRKIFVVFGAACVPAYFLSALWLPLPLWVYIIVVLAALAQLLAWIILLRKILANRFSFFTGVTKQTSWILILSGIALSIKLLLQAGSTIPFLSKIAFGLRPIVIGYLHLVLLGVISLFIIGYSKMNQFIVTNRTADAGFITLITGIILNELFLMIQGISYMNFAPLPYINVFLLGAAFCMFCGVILINVGIVRRTPLIIAENVTKRLSL